MTKRSELETSCKLLPGEPQDVQEPDIIDELRRAAENLINGVIEDGEIPVSMLTDAADEIERLRGFPEPSDLEITQAEIMAIGDTVTTLRKMGEPPTVSETCYDCGVREPCDDDCPNHVDAPLPHLSEEMASTRAADLVRRFEHESMALHKVQREWLVREIAAALNGPGASLLEWQCSARKQGTAGGNAPADCDWPGCGCDPYASKVLDAIDEAGFEITKKREGNTP